MSEMNFIPSSMMLRQHNHQVLYKGGKAILISALSLLVIYLSIAAYNRNLSDQIALLVDKKNQVNELLKLRDLETSKLAESQLVAASLDNLNSFNALEEVLSTLNSTIPSETELSNFQTEFNKSGESQTVLEGVSDSHQNLTNWLSQLKDLHGIESAELISSESIQSSSSDDLKQRFELMITRMALEEPKI